VAKLRSTALPPGGGGPPPRLAMAEEKDDRTGGHQPTHSRDRTRVYKSNVRHASHKGRGEERSGRRE
jgi:hypothetical protein